MGSPQELGAAFERGFADRLVALLGDQDTSQSGPGQGPRSSYDLESGDARFVVEIKASLLGTRDLGAAVMQLARFAAGRPGLERAILVALLPRMTSDTIAHEWQHALTVLRRDVRERLGLVAIASDSEIERPAGDAALQRLKAIARETLGPSAVRGPARARVTAWSAKPFEVWMVLLDAWLRCEGALPIGMIVRRSGASYPTVRGTLARLQARGELRRTTDRRAAFSAMPGRSMNELVPLADSFRDTRRFVDRSGRRTDPAALLRRVLAKAPRMVAVGGVAAARHHAPDFDLNGLPRVDVTVHGREPLDWIAAVDPALAEGRPEEPSPVLVVHRTGRADPRFDDASGARVRYAGPGETLVDLYDLRLTSQAEDFVRTLRNRGERPA